MSALRFSVCRFAIATALSFGFAASSAYADIPVGPRTSRPAPAPDPVEEPLAPLKVTLSEAADAQAALVIPRRFMEQAGAAGIAPASAAPKSNSLPAVLSTIAGGGALSLGVLLLGIYFLRKSHRKAQTAIAGTVAAIALFIGAGAVFGDLLPFSNGGRPPGPRPEPTDDLPKVKIVIADEGEAIHLTLPKAVIEAK